MPGLTRRELSAATATLILALAGCTPDDAEVTEPVEPDDWQTHRVTLVAMCARLLPAEGDLPAGVEIGVPAFIEQQLDLEEFASVKSFVIRGLTLLTGLAQSLHAARFDGLDASVQDALLSDFQQDMAPVQDFTSSKFFELILTLALEGYFGHPRHGGNKGFAAWDAVGLGWHR